MTWEGEGRDSQSMIQMTGKMRAVDVTVRGIV